MLKGISLSRGVDLKLRDIRLLIDILMSGEIQNVFHPGTQVYFRVDLAKVLIIDEMMVHSKNPRYTVFSDIDVQPMTPERLFDGHTVRFLSENGYVANRIGFASDFENSFFIFNREKKGLFELHRKTLIKPVTVNMARVRDYSIGTNFRPDYLFDAQYIFKLYTKFRSENSESYFSNFNPRKIVKCPSSQFNFGGNFSKSDFQSETFRFVGKSNVPYTRNGRNASSGEESPIEYLKDWTPKRILSLFPNATSQETVNEIGSKESQKSTKAESVNTL